MTYTRGSGERVPDEGELTDYQKVVIDATVRLAAAEAGHSSTVPLQQGQIYLPSFFKDMAVAGRNIVDAALASCELQEKPPEPTPSDPEFLSKEEDDDET